MQKQLTLQTNVWPGHSMICAENSDEKILVSDLDFLLNAMRAQGFANVAGAMHYRELSFWNRHCGMPEPSKESLETVIPLYQAPPEDRSFHKYSLLATTHNSDVIRAEISGNTYQHHTYSLLRFGSRILKAEHGANVVQVQLQGAQSALIAAEKALRNHYKAPPLLERLSKYSIGLKEKSIIELLRE